MPLRSQASRPAKLSTSDWVRSRVRPSPRSSSHSVCSATPSGSPSNVNVCTMRSGRTSWKEPWNAYSAPSCTETYRQLPPVGASQCSIRVVSASGPTHRANSAGSVWARNSCPGVAANSRVIRMTGSFGSASIAVCVAVDIVGAVLVVGVAHGRQEGVQAAVPLLCAPPVSLDPGLHLGEDPGLQSHQPGLRPMRPANQPGVLQDPQVLVDSLQTHPVRLGQLAHRRVAFGEPDHDVAARRIGEGGEDPGQCVSSHRLPVSTSWLNLTLGPAPHPVNHPVESRRRQSPFSASGPVGPWLGRRATRIAEWQRLALAHARPYAEY